MSPQKIMYNFVVLFSTIIVFSHCQGPESKKNIEQLEEELCSEKQESIFENIVYLPENIFQIQEILREICRNLNFNDLCSVRTVCKNLKSAADREIMNRHFDVLNVPITRHIGNIPTEDLRHTLKVKPKLAIFFTERDSSFESRTYYDSISKELMSQYMPELPKDCTLLHATGSFAILNNIKNESNKNRALAIFFSETKKIRIRYASLDQVFYYDVSGEDTFLKTSFPEELGSEHDQSNSFAYLLFNQKSPMLLTNFDMRDKILEKLTGKYKENSGRFALWGSDISSMILSNSDPNLRTFNFGASISGSGVKSWSLVIDTAASKSEILRKITEFKNYIHLSSKKVIAFSLITTQNYRPEGISFKMEESPKKLALFSQIFPDLTIVTFGVDEEALKYCIDSWIELKVDESPVLAYGDQYACYLIITFGNRK